MEINKLFKVKSNPENVTEEFNRLQEKANSLFSKQGCTSNLEQVLTVFNRAYSAGSQNYILDILFEFQASKHKIKPHQDRIYGEMMRLNEYEPDSKEEATFLINIYRNIVSDLFDPYISLIYASLQYIDGKFDTYITSNLGQGERNKVEYCISKLNQTSLFNSYNPIVRNAISHSGSDGVTYAKHKVIFKSIKRGNPPRVESVVWTNNQLQEHIIGLIRLTQIIDLSIGIFNLDISDEIKSDDKVSHKYLDEVLTHNDRKALQEPFDITIEKMIFSDNVILKEKFNGLTSIFFIQCRKRDLDVLRVAFHEESQTAIIEVNGFHVDTNSQQDMSNSIIMATRFGIVAESCFKSLIKNYVILGEGEKEKQFRLEAPASIFHDYNDEKAGLLDLASEVKASVGDIILNVNVDFDKLEEIEIASLGRKFPRRNS